MIYLLSRLTLHITNNLLGLSNNLINNLLRLGPRLLDRLDVGTGCLLWCSSSLGLSRSRLLSSGRGSGSFGLGDAARDYFAGAGLGRVGFGGRAAFCGRDSVFDLLDETGLGVTFGKRLVFCCLVGKRFSRMEAWLGQCRAVCVCRACGQKGKAYQFSRV